MKTLLEREPVLAELAGLGRRAGSGAGQVALLRGEAGVGKTAVIDRFLEQRGPQVRVLRGWCDPLSVPRPLGPLVDMVAQLPAAEAAGLAEVINRGEPESIFTGLLRLLGDGQHWVCVIEDLHWAAEATLDLLRFLARRVGALHVLLVGSYRDDEVSPAHPLAVALGDMTSCVAVTRIEVCPLSRDAVAVLAAGSGVNAAQLHQLTGGNAFFVTEVLAAGRQTLEQNALPRSVSEAVWGRLGRLSTAARDAAYAVAVCGPWIERGVLTAVCPGGLLDECLSAGVLVTDGAGVGFRHELARRATLDQIPGHQRRLLHTRALAVLAEEPIPPAVLGALAFHADQAGDDDAAVRYGAAGAEWAAALGANRQAADLYALVLQHADTAANEQKVGWLERHALTSYLSGSAEAAACSWREAIALRHQMGHRLEEGDDWRQLSLALWPLGRVTEAVGAARTSLRILEGLQPSLELAWALVHAAVLAAHTYDPGCAGYATRAMTLGHELGEAAVVIRARGAAALSEVCRCDTGWDELEAAWHDAAATEGLAEHAGMIGASLCVFAALHQHLDRAQRSITEVSWFCEQHELGMYHLLAVAAGGMVALHRGDWDSAAAIAEDVRTRPSPSPVHRILALIPAALIRARRGQRSPVSPLLDEALGCSKLDDFVRLGAVRAARAEAAWLAGDDDTARAEAHSGLASAPGVMADPWLVGNLRRWAHLTGGAPDSGGVVDTVTPYRFEISGDWQAAADEWTRLGCPYDAAVAQLGGDSAAAQAARATFRRLGARAAARRAQQRLAQLRGRTPSGRRADTLADPHLLTRRQRDVLELIAAGHSDTDIATKLCISPRTAAHHVEAILTKLGANNRTQAAAVYKVESAANGRGPK